MAIVTDELHNNGNDYLFVVLGESILFRKSEYIIEYPLYRYRSNLSWAMDEIKTGRIHISNSEELNDPFDPSYALDIDAFLNSEILQLKEHISKNDLRAFDSIDSLFANLETD